MNDVFSNKKKRWKSIRNPNIWTKSFEKIFFVLVDINECTTEEHGCEQMCVNTVGSYFCMCRDGYFLYQDERTCLGKMLSQVTSNINEF